MKLAMTRIALFLLLLAAATQAAFAQSATAFTHQGRLTDNGAAASGAYDLQFALFDALNGGAQQGATLTRDDVPVTNGVFTVQLDFGATPFNGAARWLQISVRNGASTGAYTPLTPRQPLSATPYAIRSQAAVTADALSANCVGCITATQIQGGGNFIQNTTTPQANANFNISGAGTAGTLSATTLNGNVVNAATQFSLNNRRILSNAGTSNLFAGESAGAVNSSGGNNAFIGAFAGQFNTSGGNNVFVGHSAGLFNQTGSNNTLLGSAAGVGGGGLSFATALGAGAVVSTSNTLVLGRSADTVQIPGVINAATQYDIDGRRVLSVPGFYTNLSVGAEAGQPGPTSDGNTFIGYRAGEVNTIGDDNTFVGSYAGDSNTTGSSNTLIGGGADVAAPNLRYATAIGALARVSTSDTIVLGRDGGQDKVRIPGLGAAGSTQLCRNANNELATCSSSLRYKTDLAPYRHGLDFIRRLQPLSFTWKAGGQRDLGFGAEDVAKVDPLLVIHNAKGEVEGVKYDRLSALLVNAVKEQQAYIETLRQELAALKAGQTENAALKAQLAALAERLTQLEQQAASRPR